MNLQDRVVQKGQLAKVIKKLLNISQVSDMVKMWWDF